ncbi:MAG: cation:proton antiporter [Flavobacteriales bacterium]
MHFFLDRRPARGVSAAFGYVNPGRLFRLPNTIGLMLVAILFTVGLSLYQCHRRHAAAPYGGHGGRNIDFKTMVLDIMLGFLLFAGAMHTDWDQLKEQLAHPGLRHRGCASPVPPSSWGLSHRAFAAIGHPVAFIHCLLFGAPSALPSHRCAGRAEAGRGAEEAETKDVGESLFNDGVGVVVFLTISASLRASTRAPVERGTEALRRGGLRRQPPSARCHGSPFRLMRSINDQTEVADHPGLCDGGASAAAHMFRLSEPLAIGGGLIVGNAPARPEHERLHRGVRVTSSGTWWTCC